MGRIDLASQFADVRSRVAAQATAPTAPVAAEGPKYRRLTRKEVLLRPDQLADLTALARQKMRQRRVRTERITENTLVRIAIDVLLDNQDLLAGSTETELSDGILRSIAGRCSCRAHAGGVLGLSSADGPDTPNRRDAALPDTECSRDVTQGASS